MRLQDNHAKVTIIQVYAVYTNNSASEQDKNELYERLHNILDAAPEHDLKIIIGDFNSQIRTQDGRTQSGQKQWEREQTTERDYSLSAAQTKRRLAAVCSCTRTFTRVL